MTTELTPESPTRQKRLLRRIGRPFLTGVGIFTAFLLITIGPIPLPDSPVNGPHGLPKDFMKGITMEEWWNDQYASPAADATLKDVILPTGANWVEIVVKCTQEAINSTTITCDTKKITPTDASLIHAIQVAHRLGLSVLLKPHLDLPVSDLKIGRDSISFGGDEPAWEEWFDHYTTFITHYAEIAQTAGADYFVVGTELSSTVYRGDDWRKVIRAVRQVYKGPLTYASIGYRDEFTITWWDALDAIGIDVYYPLTMIYDPNMTKLKLGWIPPAMLLDWLANRWQKPIIFTEVGYLSVAGTNRNPWNWALDGPTDMQEQANCYRALFETFQDKPWWHGVFWWSWSIDPNQGGPAERGFTAHGKLAEDVLKAYFSG